MEAKLKGINSISLIVLAMIGVRMLTLPRDIVEYANSDAWMSVLLGGILTLITGTSFYWLGVKYKGLNISQIMEAVLGKFIGKIIQIFISMYIILSVGLSLRAFSESINVFLLDKTPRTIVTIIMLAACVYCLTKGLKTISIMMDLLLPGILFFILLLLFLSITNIDKANLLPVLHKGPMPVFKGFVEIIHPFLGLGIVGYIMPFLKEPRKDKKWIFISIAIVTFIYLSIITMCIMVFGSNEIKQLVYPTIILSKSIQLQSQIFERAESLFMTAWIPISFSTIVIYYFASCHNLNALFNTTKYKLMIYLQIPVILFIANFPRNVVKVYHYLSFVNYLAISLSIIVIILPIISLLRKDRNKNSYEKNKC